MTKEDQALASQLATLIAAARTALEREMQAAGLRATDGWRINEQIRHTIEGTEFIFRPIHMRLQCEDMERCVRIDPDGHPL